MGVHASKDGQPLGSIHAPHRLLLFHAFLEVSILYVLGGVDLSFEGMLTTGDTHWVKNKELPPWKRESRMSGGESFSDFRVFPVLHEALDTGIGERVFDELSNDTEGNGRDIGADHRRFNDVDGVTYGGDEHFGF